MMDTMDKPRYDSTPYV
ncbi:MAG: hypothetical protein F9K13_02460 [Candidatus Methylomirabilis oxygeniifera]|nr:MAG: hypothetical protein F9K13_02460 [Candidatus Methylomirabilis oxyfera]